MNKDNLEDLLREYWKTLMIDDDDNDYTVSHPKRQYS